MLLTSATLLCFIGSESMCVCVYAHVCVRVCVVVCSHVLLVKCVCLRYLVLSKAFNSWKLYAKLEKVGDRVL